MATLSTCIAIFVCQAGSADVTDIPWNGRVGDRVPSLVYNPTNGYVSFESDGHRIKAVEILSSRGRFIERVDIGKTAEYPFDVVDANRVFILRTAGFKAVDLGPLLPPGLSGAELSEDISIRITAEPHEPERIDIRIVNGSRGRWLIGLLVLACLIGLVGLVVARSVRNRSRSISKTVESD